MNQLIKTIIQGLWKNNSTLIQLLGICPILAVTTTAINALGLGLVTTFVLILSNFFISLLRHWIQYEIRIPIYVIIISSIVSIIHMLVNAFSLSLYESLGIFIPLITTNCVVLGRAEIFAIKNKPLISAADGLIVGIGFTYIIFIIGSLREILGRGTLFEGADILLGSWAKVLRIEIFNTKAPFLLFILPPGGFIILGMILAIKNLIDAS